jgi:hypothetical protein
MTPNGQVDGCGTGIVLLFAAAVLALFGAGATLAQEPWDKSSITLDGKCLPDGRAEFTVTNTGEDMAGPAQWREYEHTALTNFGTFQLAAGESQVWAFVSNGWQVRFEADQRPGHPGTSEPKLTKTCSIPTAVALTTFVATSSEGCRLGYIVDRMKVRASSWWHYGIATRRSGAVTATGMSLIKYPLGMYVFACNNKVMLP